MHTGVAALRWDSATGTDAVRGGEGRGGEGRVCLWAHMLLDDCADRPSRSGVLEIIHG
jgi:hypothetical protein